MKNARGSAWQRVAQDNHHPGDGLGPITRMFTVRSRTAIGHQHRIWNLDLAARYTDLLGVAGYIDPDLESWIDPHSRVRGILAQRP